MSTTDEDPIEEIEQKIVYIKLVTGDEVVGDCLGEDDKQTVVIIKHPMVMAEIVNPYTQAVGLTLARYSLCGPGHYVVPFKHEHIVTMTPVVDEMVSFYNNSVTFHKEIADKNVLEELESASAATKSAVMCERKQRDFEDEIIKHATNIIIPSNTSIH